MNEKELIKMSKEISDLVIERLSTKAKDDYVKPLTQEEMNFELETQKEDIERFKTRSTCNSSRTPIILNVPLRLENQPKRLSKSRVYDVVNQERAYQDKKWPQNPALPPSDELRLVRGILDKADKNWYVTQDEVIDGIKVNPADLDAARQIAAVCVRLMETWGVAIREDYYFQEKPIDINNKEDLEKVHKKAKELREQSKPFIYGRGILDVIID